MWTIGIFLLLAGGVQSELLIDPRLKILPEGEGGNWEKLKSNIQEQLEANGESFDLTSLLERIFVALKSSSFPTAVAQNITQQCLEDSQFYVRSLYTNQTLWALQSKSINKKRNIITSIES